MNSPYGYGKSLHHMLAPGGNPNTENFFGIVPANVAGEPTIDAFVEQQPHKAVSIKRSLAISRKEMI
jgi:hypothetical protein